MEYNKHMEKLGVVIGHSKETKVFVAYGPDVVHAPPAFKGQQSRKGATKARFAMIAERLAKARKG